MYYNGAINISYQTNGNLRVHCTNLSSKNIIGKVKPSCEGYVIFGDNEQKTFEFNEEDKEIVWYGDTDKWIRACFDRATDKWIKGCFCCVLHNLYIQFEEERGAR